MGMATGWSPLRNWTGGTLEQVQAAQVALIAEYARPKFQKELWKAFVEAGDDKTKQDRAVRDLIENWRWHDQGKTKSTEEFMRSKGFGTMDEVMKAIADNRSDPWVARRKKRMDELLHPGLQCADPTSVEVASAVFAWES